MADTRLAAGQGRLWRERAVRGEEGVEGSLHAGAVGAGALTCRAGAHSCCSSLALGVRLRISLRSCSMNSGFCCCICCANCWPLCGHGGAQPGTGGGWGGLAQRRLPFPLAAHPYSRLDEAGQVIL